MNKQLAILSLIIGLIFSIHILQAGAQSPKLPSIIGTWSGYDQTDWPVMLIFKEDMTVRVMLREFTWDTPYSVDFTKNPASIDINDFEAEPATGVNQRDYRLPETPFLGIVSISGEGKYMTLEGYNGKGRPQGFSKNAIKLTRDAGSE